MVDIDRAIAETFDRYDEKFIDYEPVTAATAIDWIENHFYLYDTGKLSELHPIQKRIIRKALSRDENGLYRFQTILISMIKKSAKSTLIAQVVDVIAQFRPYASIKLVANDLKQADSRVGHYLREAIKIGQKRGDQAREGVYIKPSGYLITYPNGSRVEMIPIDPRGEAGGNDDLIVFSELWGWKNKAHQDMWAEMTLSPNKFGHSQRWIDTYAGYSDGGSPILEALYKQVVKPEYCINEDYELYANERAMIFACWVTRPMFPWQTKAYYKEQKATLVSAQFSRMHENQWQSDERSFVPIEWWDGGEVDKLDKVSTYKEMVVGLDAGTDSDCFAIVGVTREQMDDKDVIAVRYTRAWYPEHYDQFDFSEPKTELRRLAERYNIIQWCYDPYQLKELADNLNDEGLGWFEPFKQGAERAEADKMLHDLIRQSRMAHRGEPDLHQHIVNANAKDEGEKLRIIKRSESLKIDLTVALSMATKRCRDLIPGEQEIAS